MQQNQADMTNRELLNALNSALKSLQSAVSQTTQQTVSTVQMVANYVQQGTKQVTGTMLNSMQQLSARMQMESQKQTSMLASQLNQYASMQQGMSAAQHQQTVSILGGMVAQVQNQINSGFGVVSNKITQGEQAQSKALYLIRDAINNIDFDSLDDIDETLSDKLTAIKNSIDDLPRDFVHTWQTSQIQEESNLGSGFLDFIHSLQNNLAPLQGIIAKLMENRYTSWDEFKADVQSIHTSGWLASGLIDTVLLFLISMNSIQGAAGEYGKNLAKLAREDANNAELSANELLTLLNLEPSLQNEIIPELQKLGYDSHLLLWLLRLRLDPLNETEIRDAYLRGLITDIQRDEFLAKLGVVKEVADIKKQLYDVMPFPQDLVRFAVRDIYDPAVVSDFGLDQEFPEKFAEEAQKVGMSRELAQEYWKAHWSNPSVTQGFEMYQRDIITWEQLNVLMKALDIIPKWREYLLQMSYHTIARVDIRRMHAMGNITDDELLTRYRHAGYSPEDAKLLQEWTIDYNSNGGLGGQESTRDLTRTMIEKSYLLGQLDKFQAIDALVELGYSRDNAEFILELKELEQSYDMFPDNITDNVKRIEKQVIGGYKLGLSSEQDVRVTLESIGWSQDDINLEISFTDYEAELELNQLLIDTLKDLRLKEIITDAEMRSQLTSAGFTDKGINRVYKELQIQMFGRDRSPTKADLESWLMLGIIDIDEYFVEMQGIGFNFRTAQKFLIQIMLETGLI